MPPSTSSPAANGVFIAIRILAYVATAAIATVITYGGWTALRYWSGINV